MHKKTSSSSLLKVTPKSPQTQEGLERTQDVIDKGKIRKRIESKGEGLKGGQGFKRGKEVGFRWSAC